MFLSDLQNKDIINTKTGKKLGHIIDAKIDDNGTIIFLVVETKRISITNNDINVNFNNIEKIGEDVILVNI